MARYDVDALVHEAEWRRCENDVVHWANNFVHVVALDLGGRVLMDTSDRPYQAEGLRMLADPTQRRIITLKSRQVGWTTTCAVAALWWVLFHPDQYVLFISRREDDARDILHKADYAYRWLPDWMRNRAPERIDKTTQRMTFANDSLIRSEQSQSDPARGQTASLIICDEFASLDKPEEAWAAIEPVADIGGRVMILSTAKGAGNLFHTMWQGAATGRSGFRPVFIPWSAVPSRDQAWFDRKVDELLPWIRAQEYPNDPDEAFVMSGAMVFDYEAIKAQERTNTAPARWVRITEDFGVIDHTGPMRDGNPAEDNKTRHRPTIHEIRENDYVG
jgi:hypothetical protein